MCQAINQALTAADNFPIFVFLNTNKKYFIDFFLSNYESNILFLQNAW